MEGTQFSEDSEDISTENVVTLVHPNGSKVYVVATAHISSASQRDVEDTIDKVRPSIVVIELDAERLSRLSRDASSGDMYGVGRYKSTGTLGILRMALNGDVMAYVSGLVYTCTGTLMGTRPGGEFLVAAEAANNGGIKLILGDRPMDVTMRRLRAYTHKLLERSREAASRDAGGLGVARRVDPSLQEMRESENFARSGSGGQQPGDPWGLGPDEDYESESAAKSRVLRMMREGGCPQPNAVLEAAQRLLKAGLDPKTRSIDVKDVLEVRGCGKTLIETFRHKALTGDDSWMKDIEVESVAGAKGALGARRHGMALRKVIIDERDVILARRLWEAGEEGGGQSVVGVVGAGHVRGIQAHWPKAGTPEFAALADDYGRIPTEEGHPSLVGTVFTAGVISYLAYRRPRAMGFFLGAATLATAPYLGFTVLTVRRLTNFAEKLAVASQHIQEASPYPSEYDWQTDQPPVW